MTYQDIIKSLQAKDFKPVYLLHGEESYYIDSISNFIEKNVLAESERAFNQTIFYGKDADARSLVDTARRYPMMAPYQVVILKEAQEMKDIADLQLYIEKPATTTILVICHKHKKLDTRTKFGKSLKEHAFVFESKKLYENQVPDWIANYVSAKKMKIQPKAAQLVAEYLGNDLSKIANELDKLAINLPSETSIDEKLIQNHIGISKDYNIFELQKALGQRNILKANQIVNYFISNPKKHPLVMVTANLGNYFSKVYMLHFLQNQTEKEQCNALGLKYDFFLKEYKTTAKNFKRKNTEKVISILREYDLKSKGVNSDSTSDGELLKEMIYKILH